MSVSGSDEYKETVDDSPASAISEEGFRAVFGGMVPVATPWAGLMFI